MKKFIILGTMSLLLAAIIVPNAFAKINNTSETDTTIDSPAELTNNSYADINMATDRNFAYNKMIADSNSNKDKENAPQANPYNYGNQGEYWQNHFNYMGSMMGGMMGYGMMGGYYGPNTGSGYNGWGGMMGGYYGPNAASNSNYNGWGGMMGGYGYPYRSSIQTQ